MVKTTISSGSDGERSCVHLFGLFSSKLINRVSGTCFLVIMAQMDLLEQRTKSFQVNENSITSVRSEFNLPRFSTDDGQGDVSDSQVSVLALKYFLPVCLSRFHSLLMRSGTVKTPRESSLPSSSLPANLLVHLTSIPLIRFI